VTTRRGSSLGSRPRCCATSALIISSRRPRRSRRGGRNGPWTLRRTGDLKLNDVLIHALWEEHGATRIPSPWMLEVLGEEEGEAFHLQPVFDAVMGGIV
jgi:hypothetical protein